MGCLAALLALQHLETGQPKEMTCCSKQKRLSASSNHGTSWYSRWRDSRKRSFGHSDMQVSANQNQNLHCKRFLELFLFMYCFSWTICMFEPFVLLPVVFLSQREHTHSKRVYYCMSRQIAVGYTFCIAAPSEQKPTGKLLPLQASLSVLKVRNFGDFQP